MAANGRDEKSPARSSQGDPPGGARKVNVGNGGEASPAATKRANVSRYVTSAPASEDDLGLSFYVTVETHLRRVLSVAFGDTAAADMFDNAFRREPALMGIADSGSAMTRTDLQKIYTDSDRFARISPTIRKRAILGSLKRLNSRWTPIVRPHSDAFFYANGSLFDHRCLLDVWNERANDIGTAAMEEWSRQAHVFDPKNSDDKFMSELTEMIRDYDIGCAYEVALAAITDRAIAQSADARGGPRAFTAGVHAVPYMSAGEIDRFLSRCEPMPYGILPDGLKARLQRFKLTRIRVRARFALQLPANADAKSSDVDDDAQTGAVDVDTVAGGDAGDNRDDDGTTVLYHRDTGKEDTPTTSTYTSATSSPRNGGIFPKYLAGVDSGDSTYTVALRPMLDLCLKIESDATKWKTNGDAVKSLGRIEHLFSSEQPGAAFVGGVSFSGTGKNTMLLDEVIRGFLSRWTDSKWQEQTMSLEVSLLMYQFALKLVRNARLLFDKRILDNLKSRRGLNYTTQRKDVLSAQFPLGFLLYKLAGLDFADRTGVGYDAQSFSELFGLAASSLVKHPELGADDKKALTDYITTVSAPLTGVARPVPSSSASGPRARRAARPRDTKSTKASKSPHRPRVRSKSQTVSK